MNTSYQPVVRVKRGQYRGAALVGTHSAIIAWTLDAKAPPKNLLGFAIRRTELDPDTNEVTGLAWLRGGKRFADTDTGAEDVSSLEAPFQRFRWSDYTLSSTSAYRFEVFPMRGTPRELERDEPPLTYDLRPSSEDNGDLGVFVNRGVTAAMAYLRRFRNRRPDEIGPPAYAWLSRGLKESLLALIRRARRGQSLHVAIYEFFDHEIAGALRDALYREVDVRIVHDAKPGKRSTAENLEVVKHFHLQAVATGRTTVNISHNKIVIRLGANGKAIETWTGSANFTENAFHFQTNTALIIRDPHLMRHFELYFQALTGNPSKADSKKLNRAIIDSANSPEERFAKRTFFSPLRTSDILEASVEMIRSARSAILVSAPFGLPESMVEALGKNPTDVVEYGLVNSTAKKKIEKLRTKNTRFFTPTRLASYMGRAWDAKAFGAHKIHAKSLVVDPWSKNPKILIGSANFSKPSCRDNDENALLIEGDSRLTSIIASEFMRMYDHYKARFYIQQMGASVGQFLTPDSSWSRTAFNPRSTSHKFRDRIVFSGQE